MWACVVVVGRLAVYADVNHVMRLAYVVTMHCNINSLYRMTMSVWHISQLLRRSGGSYS